VARAAGKATDRAARGALLELRQAMRAALLGKLTNAVGASSDLKKGRPQGRVGDRLDVAGFVIQRGRSERKRGALDAYVGNASTEIVPRRGRFLWFATPEIPKRAGRRRMTPALYRASGLEQKIGPLQFIQGRNAGVAYLVAESVTIRSDKAGKALRVPKSGRVGRGRANVGIVAFIGIRRTRRQRRVEPGAIAQPWQAQMALLLREELGRTR
jgi:hypothetical protein